MPSGFLIATFSDADTLLAAVRAATARTFASMTFLLRIPFTDSITPWECDARGCRGSHLL